MSANVVHLAHRRPARTVRAPRSEVVVSAELGADFKACLVVVTVLDEDGEPVEGRLTLAAARALVDQLEAAIQVGEELGRRG